MPLEKSPLARAPGPIAKLADQCVQCGLCLPVCPTYALDRNEAESPRGRIAIAAALARGMAEPSAALREHLDHCLGCLNCEQACPANVQYGELLIHTRALLGPSPSRPTRLINLIKQPARLRQLRRLGRFAGLAQWKSWLARRMPRLSPWRTALQMWPATPAPPPVRADAPDAGSTRVALFPGCVASVDDAAAEQAAVRLLQAAGFTVRILPAFCCGAIDLHGGETQAAEASARRVRAAWDGSGAEHLVSVTPGCLGTLRRALPAVRVLDPVELLAERADRLHFRPLAWRVALHLPCTQINVARSEGSLLQTVAPDTRPRRGARWRARRIAAALQAAICWNFPSAPASCVTLPCVKSPRWNRGCCCRPISAVACIWRRERGTPSRPGRPATP